MPNLTPALPPAICEAIQKAARAAPPAAKPAAPRDVSTEARVPKGAKGGGEWTTGTHPSTAPNDAETATAAPSKYARPAKGIFSMPLSKLTLDPKRMQFRADVNPVSGTDDRLAGVEKFDQTLAGVFLVWHDPASNKTLIADGHHRYALAKRLKVREVRVEFIDAPDAGRAMIRAAMVNIASGHAAPLDVAKLFRAEGQGERALRKAGIALEGTVAAKGLALSKLAPSLWERYVKGALPEGRAVAIGRNFKTHAEQEALAGLLDNKKYKNASDAVVAEIAKQVPSAGRQTKTIQTLFGEESITKNLAVEKAQLSVAIRAKLMADKKLFGFVAKTGRADVLKRGNNVIDAQASGKIADEASRLAAVYDHISGYAGSLSTLLSAGAKQIAEGASVNGTAESIFPQIRDSIEREFGAGFGGGRTGSGTPDPEHPAGERQDDGGLFRGVEASFLRRGLKVAVLLKAVARQRYQIGEHSYLSDVHPGALSLGDYTRKYGSGQKPASIRTSHDAAVAHAVETGIAKPSHITEHDPDLYSLNGAQHSRVSDVLARLAPSAAHNPKHVAANDAGQVRLEWEHQGKTHGMAINKMGGTSLKEGLKPEHFASGGWRVLKKYEAAKDMNKSVHIAILMKGGCQSCTAKPHTVSQAVRDAHHANKHAAASACDHENAQTVMIAGEKGKDGKTAKYPGSYCPRCGRVALDDKKHHKLASGTVPMPVLAKAVAANCYKNPKECDLCWITCHPNGAEPGVPLLVHDNGEQYTVVGGAGGRLNQQVFQKPKGDGSGGERKAQMKEKRVAKQKAAREALGSAAQDLEDKKQALHAEAKRQTNDLTNRVLQSLGDQFQGDALGKVQAEARKRALKEHSSATEGEQKDFADKAAKEAVHEASAAARKLVQAALDKAAMRSLGDDDGTPAEFSAKISGATLVKKFTPEELDSFVQSAAHIAALKGQAKAIQRALATGDQDAVQGIQADVAPMTQAEADKQNVSRYLNEDSVNAQTSLVKGSEAASTITQRRNQANGASDGLNSFVAAQSGSAILRPDMVKTLGVENAARVAASYLTANGANAKDTAEGLRDRIGQQSYASVKGCLDRVADLDKVVQGFKDAAAQGDGSVTVAQSSIQAANAAVQRYKLLNVTRGQLRSAAALAHHLEHPSKRSLSVPAGSTSVGAHAFAKGLGLKDGDYAVEKAAHGEGGGYKVTVEADNLHKLAQKHSEAESDRSIDMDDLRQEVEQNPGQWKPQGIKDTIMAQPHQELAIRSMIGQKRMVLNMGAGSGKTLCAYAAASHLLETGKIDRALISMPKGPRGQQGRDFYDETDRDADGKPKLKLAEKNKFLSPDLADKVAVCEGSDDIKKAIKGLADGSVKIVIVSPAGMRDNVELLQSAGFGGERSSFFADEAHELAIGHGKGDGAGWSQAAREMAKSEYATAASGSLVRSDGSELHSIYDMIHPGELGKQNDFKEEYLRLAQGRNDFFSSESMRGMRDRLSGGMVSYHKEPSVNGEPLELIEDNHEVPVSPEQKAAIAKAQAQYQKDRKSDDDAIRKGASFKLDRATTEVLNKGVKGEDGGVINPKLAKVQELIDKDKAADGDSRTGLFSYEREPLRRAVAHLKGRKFLKIDGENSDKETGSVVSQVNTGGNGVDGVTLGKNAVYGLNMQKLKRIIKMGPMLTAADETQLNHRHLRSGATENKIVSTITTNHPLERKKQYVVQNVKRPQLELLAALADHTSAANVLAKNMDAIKAVANGER